MADNLLARNAVARGNLAEGVTCMQAALEQLRLHPCPIVTWKIESACGRAHAELGDRPKATAAFKRASAIVHEIAGHVADEQLRTTFLNSPAVRDVIEPPDLTT